MADDDTQTHYVAEVKITKVTKGTRRSVGQVTATREVSTIARVVVPGRDLNALKTKVAAHVELVDDDGDVEEVR